MRSVSVFVERGAERGGERGLPMLAFAVFLWDLTYNETS